MPKISQTPLQRCVRFQQMFPQEFIINSNLQLECILCICSVKADKKHNVISHRKSTKHQRHLQQHSANSDFTPVYLEYSSSNLGLTPSSLGLASAKLDFSPANLAVASSKLDFTRSNLDLNHVDGRVERQVMNKKTIEYNMKQMMAQSTSAAVGTSIEESSQVLPSPAKPDIVKVENGLVRNWVGTSGYTGDVPQMENQIIEVPQHPELKRKRKNSDQPSFEGQKKLKLSKTSGKEFQKNHKRLLKGKTIQEKFLQYQRDEMKRKQNATRSIRRNIRKSVKVEHLPPMVSNELLAESFCIFGVVDRGVVIVDNKGQSTTRAIVEFNNEQAARNAVQQIQEGSFLMTSSPRPISATLMEHEDSEVGLPEEKLPKSTQYYSDRKSLPRFAEPGTFEDLCANTWKVRYNLEREQREQFDKNIGETRAVFELEIENCRRAMQLKQENPVEREILEEKRQHEVEERRQNETARFDEHHNKMTESEIRQKVLGSQIEKQMSTSSVVTSSQQQQHYSGERTSIIPTRGAVAAAAASSSNAVAPYNPTQLTKQPPAAHPITAGSSNRADKKRFKCPQCPKRYSHSCNLTTHMRIHDKERQVKCEICSKVFATKHQYMSHMITHSSTRNRKKFQQRQLQISARQQQQQQQEVHKFLKCLECRGGGKYFRTPEALSVHMATTHKASISNEGNFSSRRSGTVVTYSCVYCDEKFTESETLRIHVTTHTENKYKFN